MHGLGFSSRRALKSYNPTEIVQPSKPLMRLKSPSIGAIVGARPLRAKAALSPRSDDTWPAVVCAQTTAGATFPTGPPIRER
jgi:hypothetical protein